jgi:hypothetical protein
MLVPHPDAKPVVSHLGSRGFINVESSQQKSDAGASFAFRRSLWLDLGGFDPELGRDGLMKSPKASI